MRHMGGMEQLVLGACVVCCGTIASFGDNIPLWWHL
jgi:hypothetical protein